MKLHFTATLALAALVSTATHAATVVQNYEEAKDQVGEDGFVLVVYPDAWGKKAESLGRAILGSAEINKAAGQAMLMGIAIPNISTKEVQDARKEQLGPIKLDLGRAQSYPAIYMCEASGRNYSVIPAHMYRKPDSESASVSAAAALVGERLAAIKKQRELMSQVEGAEGQAKTDLISQATRLDCISRPDKVLDLVKKIDPQNQFHLQDALSYDWYNLVWTCVRDDWKKGLARCEELITNPYLTPQQKQLVYLCAMGTLRRNCGAEGLEKMRRYGKEMRMLDPTSRWGRSYDGAMRLWDARFSLECGWSAATLPPNDEPAECDGPWPIREPGTYKITFTYTSGSHALMLSKVELYDGDAKVAEDAHPCTAGHKVINNVYTLKVDAPVQNPRVIVTTKMGQKRNSAGKISVSKE